MSRLTLAVVACVALIAGDQALAQFSFKKKTVAPRAHDFELKSSAGEKRILALVKHKSQDIMHVERDALLAVPMELLAIPTDLATGEFVEPGARLREKAETVKLVLKLSSKVIDQVSDRAEFLEDFVNRVPCLHPRTGKEVAFKEYLEHYVAANGYVDAGYFARGDLEDDPVGVFLRLLLFDKWVLYNARLIHGSDGGLHSLYRR